MFSFYIDKSTPNLANNMCFNIIKLIMLLVGESALKYFYYSIFVILTFIFLYTPYEKGLFFDYDLLKWQLILSSLFLVYIGLSFVNKSINIHTFFLFAFIWPLLYILAIPLARSPQGNFEEIYQWTTYAIFFVMLISLKNQINDMQSKLSTIFYGSGFLLVITSMLMYGGFIDFQDSMLGERLAGPFQYPNTFAAVMGAFWLYGLMMLIRSNLSTSSMIFFSLPLMGFIFTIFQSYSRGAWLALFFVWLVTIYALKVEKQIQLIIYSFVSALSGFMLFFFMNRIDSTITKMGSVVLIGAISSLLLVLIYNILNKKRSLEEIKNNRIKRPALPMLMTVLPIAFILDITNKGLVFKLLPLELQNRLTQINLQTGSVEGRLRFYKQALEMLKDAPLFGFGGDGWRILYTHYQQEPYLSNEVHNGYLEMLLNIGLIGTVALIGTFSIFLIAIIKRIKLENRDEIKLALVAIFPPLAMLTVHSAIDFNFSYGTIWFMIIWLLAIGAPIKPMFDVKKTIGNTLLLFSVVTVIGVTIFSSRAYLAEKAIAFNDSVSVNQAQVQLEKAIKYNPYNTDYYMPLLEIYRQQYKQSQDPALKDQLTAYASKVSLIEPKNPKASYESGLSLITIGEKEKGIAQLEKAVEGDRFNPQYTYQLLLYKSQFLMEQMNTEGKLLREEANEITTTYETYMQNYNRFKEKDIVDKKSMEIDAKVHFVVGQIYFLLEQFDRAIQTLNKVENQDQELSIRLKAIEVISYEKQGQTEKAKQLSEKYQKQFANFNNYLQAFNNLLKVSSQ